MDTRLASAWALHQAGRLDEAEAGYRRLLQDSPRDADAVNCFGILLLQAGRAREARELYRAFVADQPANAAVQTNLARAALKLGIPDEVLVAAEAAIAAGGGEGAWLMKGVALRELDLGPDSIEAFRAALSHYPDSFPLRYNLAACQLAVGDIAAAEQGYAQLAAARPRDASAWLGWGNALAMQGNLAQAESALRRAAGFDPELTGLRMQLALLLIRTRRPGEALPLLRTTLARNPGDQTAVAALGIAAALAGDGAARPFEDLAALVHCAALPFEAGSDPAFQETLVAEVLAHPSLRDERTGKTTRVGAQTANLVDAPGPALQAFVSALRQALPARIERLAQRYGGTHHPLAGTRPGRWRLNLWATVLRTGGHQQPHMHPAGWMSGVYYLATPGIAADSASGWIEFGTPPLQLFDGDVAPLPRRRLQPRAGDLVTFPSYLYHHTVPHADSGLRISLAFDVIPSQDG